MHYGVAVILILRIEELIDKYFNKQANLLNIAH